MPRNLYKNIWNRGTEIGIRLSFTLHAPAKTKRFCAVIFSQGIRFFFFVADYDAEENIALNLILKLYAFKNNFTTYLLIKYYVRLRHTLEQ